MTNRPEGDAREARNHRRVAARARAQKARQQQKRRQRRVRVGIQAGVLVVLIAIVAVVTLVFVNSVQPAGPGPKNMSDGGITIGSGLRLASSALQGTQTPSADADSADPTDDATGAADTVHIALYVDYLCPICGQFEQENNAYIRGLVRSGAATVEIHPIAILTNRSQGTKYSLRAANAAACVANSSPNQFFAVNQALFAQQPDENTAGLDDGELTSVVTGTKGIRNAASIRRCIAEQRYAQWVVDQTAAVQDHGIPDTSVDALTSTPTVLVNGKRYDYTVPFSNAEFRTFVVTAAGSSFAEGDTTPTPTPTASASPTEG